MFRLIPANLPKLSRQEIGAHYFQILLIILLVSMSYEATPLLYLGTLSISIVCVLWLRILSLSGNQSYPARISRKLVLGKTGAALLGTLWGVSALMLNQNPSVSRCILGFVLGCVMPMVVLTITLNLERCIFMFILITCVLIECIFGNSEELLLLSGLIGLITGIGISLAYQKNRTRNSSVRLAAICLGALCAFGSIRLYWLTKIWTQFMQELDQREQYAIASEIAKKIEPVVSEDLDLTKLQTALYRFSSLNQKLDIYLSSDKGKVLSGTTTGLPTLLGSWPKYHDLDVEELEKFLAVKSFSFPFYSVEPIFGNRLVTFSTARIKIAGEPGYLYAVFQGNIYEKLIRKTQDVWILELVLYSSVLTLLLAAVVAFLIFNYLTSRIRKLNSVMLLFKKGDFTKRLPLSDNDEILELAVTVNQMADEIVHRSKELESLDLKLRELIAGITNDIRTPLAYVRDSVKALLEPKKSIEIQEILSIAESAYTQATLQSQVVGDLFELSKLEAQKKVLEFEECPLYELLHDIVLSRQKAMERQGITCQFNCPENPIIIHGDIALLSRAFSAVTDHALRFLGLCGKFYLSLSTNDDAAKVEIFISPFEDNNSSEVKAKHNTFLKSASVGVPLDIARRILELHKTKLEICSSETSALSYIVYFNHCILD